MKGIATTETTTAVSPASRLATAGGWGARPDLPHPSTRLETRR